MVYWGEMFNTNIRLGLVVAGMTIASVAFAAGVPSNVVRVGAKVENGKLIVDWDAATDAAGIASYRIYYSRKSILDNGGDYDDFEQTADEATQYAFPHLPYAGQKIYLAVLAVNTSGLESDAFEAETSVDLPSGDAQPGPDVGPGPQITENPPAAMQKGMTVDRIDVPNNSTVVVTFSQPLADTQQLGPGFFIIVDEQGGILEVREYAKDGATVTLTTGEQTDGRKYILGVLQRITGEDGSSIDGSAPQTPFTGMGASAESSSSSEAPVAVESSSSAPANDYGRNPNLTNPANGNEYGRNPNLANQNVGNNQNFLDLLRNRTQAGVITQPTQIRDTVPPEDASLLSLRRVLRTDGTYNVVAQWRGSPDTARDLNGYAIATTNNGYAFTPSSTIDADQTSVQYTRISPGTFGVRVSAFDQAGNRSAGIDKIITLPQSGIGLIGVMAVSGIAAARGIRRKRQA